MHEAGETGTCTGTISGPSSVPDTLDLATPPGRLMFQIFGVMAEFGRGWSRKRLCAQGLADCGVEDRVNHLRGTTHSIAHDFRSATGQLVLFARHNLTITRRLFGRRMQKLESWLR
jgi:hypothetical protein